MTGLFGLPSSCYDKEEYKLITGSLSKDEIVDILRSEIRIKRGTQNELEGFERAASLVMSKLKG